MKKTLIILIPIIFNSCVRVEKRRVASCTPTQSKEVAEFIKSSIKNANNMSDEEMEDVIHQLEKTGIKTICGQSFVNVRVGEGYPEVVDGIDSINYYLEY